MMEILYATLIEVQKISTVRKKDQIQVPNRTLHSLIMKFCVQL